MAKGKALAYICSCLPDKKSKGVLRCRCTTVGGKAKKGKILALSGGFTFDGVHCRDSEGLFVPVPQCVRRKPKAAPAAKAKKKKAPAKKKKAPAKKKKAPAKKKKAAKKK